MERKWHMTVGMPGGEYASQNLHLVVRQWLHGIYEGPHVKPNFSQRLAQMQVALLDGRPYGWTIDDGPEVATFRPCPTDLAEWLDADFHGFVPQTTGAVRIKVTGGWIYRDGGVAPFGSAHTATFVPVAGAAGITILEEPCPSP